MARRRNKARRSSSRGAASRWPAFLAGCATGAVATLLIGSTDLPTLPLGGGGAGVGSEGGETPTPSANLPFEFYTILPEMEDALPFGGERDAPAPPPPTVSPPEPVAPAPEVPAVAALEPAAEPPAPDETPSAPVVEASAPETPAPPKPVVSAAEAGGTYVLQVGSFRNAGDADRRRAALALLGLEARVQTITIDGETTWHRVQVGPYSELGALNNVRVRLRENDIEAMALKVRAP